MSTFDEGITVHRTGEIVVQRAGARRVARREVAAFLARHAALVVWLLALLAASVGARS